MKDFRILGKVDDLNRNDSGFYFRCGKALVELTVLAPDLFRFRMSRTGTLAPARTWAVVKTDWGKAAFDSRRLKNQLEIETGEIRLRVELDEFRLTVFDHAGTLLSRDRAVGWRGHTVRCWKEMPGDAKFYGCGEKVGFLNRRGRKLEMWTTDSIPHLPNTDPMYQSIPFFLGLTEGKAFGVFFNNTFRSFFDFGKEDAECYSFWAEDGELDYYFFAGPSVAEVLERYSELTGRMPLPPKWSLGFQQSRYSYYPESRVREVAAEFRRRGIPCDVLYFDIHYMDGYRVFTWDPERFPDPEKLLSDLRRDGFKPVAIIDPGVKIDPDYPVFAEGTANDYFCRLKSGEFFRGEVWPGEVHFPDFLKESTRRWWGSWDARLIAQGVAGIWNDMNEPANFAGPIDKDVVHGGEGEEISHAEAHNLYGLLMCKATYEGLLSHRPDERPFILTRSGFAGIQRYAAVWLGDNHSWWEHLAAAVPMLLNMGLSGVPFVGVDVGGFCDDCSMELFARWIAMGCFTPFFRVHTAYGTADQEPWSFGPECEAVAGKFIKLRYELLPYIYNCFREASLSGRPIMQPLFMAFQEDAKTYEIDDEYLFGPALLVAPVYRPGLTYRAVYLPEGLWYDFWTGEKYAGGRAIAVDAPLDRIPLFVRGGSVVPRGPVMNFVGEKLPEFLMYDLFPDGDSVYEFYEDDGLSRDYLQGVFCTTVVFCSLREKEIVIKIGKRNGAYRPPDRTVLLRIRRRAAKEVSVGGTVLERIEDENLFRRGQEGWSVLDGDPVVRLADDGGERIVRIRFE